MITEIETILGTSEYPYVTVVIAAVVFVFILHSMIALLVSIFKHIGGIS